MFGVESPSLTRWKLIHRPCEAHKQTKIKPQRRHFNAELKYTASLSKTNVSKIHQPKMICVRLCPALLTEAFVFKAPGGCTELLLSSVHTCTTIAVMLAKTGPDKVIAQARLSQRAAFPHFPSSSEGTSALTRLFSVQYRKWFMSLHLLDLEECKGRISISPQ